MANTNQSIFNKKATEKLQSPDDLDKYVRVTNPSVWVVVGACAALLIGLLAWGLFGAVFTSVSATGVMVDNKPICYLSAEDVAKVHKGDNASFGGEPLVVSEVSTVPDSRAEASRILPNDYLVSALFNGDWAYRVVFEGDTSDIAADIPISVNITTEVISPISLLMDK